MWYTSHLSRYFYLRYPGTQFLFFFGSFWVHLREGRWGGGKNKKEEIEKLFYNYFKSNHFEIEMLLYCSTHVVYFFSFLFIYLFIFLGWGLVIGR